MWNLWALKLSHTVKSKEISAENLILYSLGPGYMEPKTQIKVTDNNQQDFHNHVYSHRLELINLSTIPAGNFVVVDAYRGQQYREQFPQARITVLETLDNAKQFRLRKNQFDYLIDARNHNQISWPKMPRDNSVVILDQVLMLKYLTVQEIRDTLENMCTLYDPCRVIFRSFIWFIDDNRLQERLDQLCMIRLKNYVVKKFLYNTELGTLEIDFIRKKLLA